MYTLRIEHTVSDYQDWKEAFDRDPVGRERAGVRRYRIMRPIDDTQYVMIDLDFDTIDEAEALLMALRTVWGRVEGELIMSPTAMIVEITESREM